MINTLILTFFKSKYRKLKNIYDQPDVCQKQEFKTLINAANDTVWGKKYDYKHITSYNDFQEKVPINDYQALYPYIERMIKGEKNVLWRGKINTFSKSSGTSGSKSKYIPVSRESLVNCNYEGASDTLCFYSKANPNTKLFTGKTISLTGALHPSELNPNALCGDISAILIKHIPDWANYFRTPPKKVSLLPDWNEKLELFAQHTKDQNVVALAGVPSWLLLILKRIMEIKETHTMETVWKNMELFMHGGVNFTPYRKQYQAMFPSDKVFYWQVYNASEGYFATQDRAFADDMLLLLNNGVFYEFIPFADYLAGNYQAYPLEDVKPDTNYVILISTNAGLWRYVIGDVVQFTSVNPYRIVITGRTNHYINAFGEELIVDNAEKALQEACLATHAIVSEYTAAPVYVENNEKASHEWLIEFKKEPDNIQLFTDKLDQSLMALNSDYEAKRSFDILLQKPIVKSVPQGSFVKWMASKGRLGGQFKVVRLSNDRTVIDDLKRSL